MILQHHGIKGQRWGVRNGPPYPINKIRPKSIKSKAKSYKPTSNRPHTDYNLDKWGRTEDTNILYVTGISGSGKSTVAKDIATKNNADLIDLDLYTFKTANKYNDRMSKSFNNFLDKEVPNWRSLQSDAYSALTKTNRRAKPQVSEWFDTLEHALTNYGKSEYGKNKVVAEGVQVLDETLFYNNKKALRNKPLIVMDTSVEDSILSRSVRDNKSIDKLLEPERRKQLEGWLMDKDILKKEMSDIK